MKTQAVYPVLDDVQIPQAMLEVWQNLLNLMAEVFHVPSALIMRVHAEEIEVFVRSENPENVYRRGERAHLNTGLYCERVMSTRRYLLVPNALSDPDWAHNPDIRLGMIAYLGFPLLWPGGEVFGTICVLDRKENAFSDTYIRILEQFRSVVEHDLSLQIADIRLRESETRYRTMFNSVLDGIYIIGPDGLIEDSNDIALQNTGLSIEELHRCYIYEVLSIPHDWSTAIMPGIRAEGSFRSEGVQKRKDGSQLHVDVQIMRMKLENRELFITVAHDINERKALERELNRIAMTDNLTGIANRRAFEFSLKQEMVQADRYGSVFTIAMLDLDHFKQVNDRFGHETGDRVLRRICDISAAHLRNADRFYRYGGEEFLILMPETGLDGAVHLAERIREAVAQENQEGVGIVTVSIGVTQFRPGEPRNSLINRVDTALYAAKSSGRNAVSVV